ncbi:MAG TPA: serine hydrolase [Xanthomonadales bacterium]|nr:serine hydrolase [Xanthomonadales bacterium]
MTFRIVNVFRVICLFTSLLFWQMALAEVEFSGSWYDPTHDGEGFVVQYIDDDLAVIYWFTYTESGDQRWFIGIGDATDSGLHVTELLMPVGGVFGPDFNPDDIVNMPVGELTLTFDSDTVGLAEYTINGASGQQSLVRLTRPVESVSSGSSAVPAKSGSWYDPTHDGEGFAVEYLENGVQVAYWFTYNRNGEQAWMIAVGTSDPAMGSLDLDMLKPIGGMFGPDFDPDDVVQVPAGAARLGLACDAAYVSFTPTDTDAFTAIDLDLQRLAGIDQSGCSDPALTNRYPIINGMAEVPDHEAGTQLSWLFERFADNDNFTNSDIEAHFTPAYLANNGISETRAFLKARRDLYPSPRLIDPVSMTSASLTGVLSGSNNADGYFFLDVSLSDGRISNLSIAPFGSGGNASVVFANDRNLDLEQAADRFASYYDQPGLLVARVTESGQCQTVVGRNEDVLRSTASVFKIWILAGLADALDDRALFYDEVVPLDGAKKVRGGPLFGEPAGLPLTIDQYASLMMGISDNSSTDMLHALAGRDRIDSIHAEFGLSQPEVMAPQLNISEQFHLFQSFPEAEALMYVNGSESFQRQFLQNSIVPLGSVETGGGGFFNESLFIPGAWRASPNDICGAFARHWQHTPGTDAQLVVDRAMQISVAQPNLRERWDRIWYKGGSLDSPFNGQLVLTHAWLMEREGERPVVVVALANDPDGNIDGFQNQSILGRIHELAAELEP